MAELKDKLKENVAGAFFTDVQCIDCDLCRQTAPKNFQRNAAEGYSYVYKQPENEDERKLCQQALEECPVDAIGKHGA